MMKPANFVLTSPRFIQKYKLKHDFIVIFHFLKMKKRLIMFGQNVLVQAIVPYLFRFLEHKRHFCLDKGKPVNIYTLYGV